METCTEFVFVTLSLIISMIPVMKYIHILNSVSLDWIYSRWWICTQIIFI